MEKGRTIAKNNLRTLREKRGISQAELAKRLDITQPAVWRMENCTRNISIPTAIAITEILGCTLDELLRA